MHGPTVGCRIRAVTYWTIVAVIFSSVVASGCGPGAARPEKSAVDVSDMSTRERATFARMVDEMLAPCALDAVTLDVCLEEKRSCKACVPAANFIAERVKAGFDKQAIRKSYQLRFGGEPKRIDVADSPTIGAANAAVTIVVWSDFECSHCKHVVPIVERIAQQHPQDVRLVHKFYPIPRHTMAKVAAKAAFAAQQQGKYWEMERLLFENQANLGEQTILEFAQSLGLNMDQVKADMEGDAAAKAIERDTAEADRLGLTGTPLIFINGREFDPRLFQVEPDLDAWVTTEIELAKGK